MALSVGVIVLLGSFRRPISNLFLLIFPIAAVAVLLNTLFKNHSELKNEIDGLSASIGKNKSATNDVNTKAQVNEKEIQLLKLQIQEIQIKSKNPLGG